MPKKSSGFASLVFGFAAGAVAVFFSKKENRVQAEKMAKKAVIKAKQLEVEYQKDPVAFKKKIKKKALSTAKRVARQATKKKVVARRKTSKR